MLRTKGSVILFCKEVEVIQKRRNKMKNLFNIDNAFKVLVVLLLSVMAFGANAASLGGSIWLWK